MREKLDIPKLIPLKESVINNKKIPRIIFQTFKTSSVPTNMYKAAMSWVEYNPKYEYRFYDDEDCITFIKQNFNPQVLQAYYRLEKGAFRADLWRYCVLYTYGGIYADIDTICKMPLSELIHDDDEFIVAAEPTKAPALMNAFICSIPQHPFLKKAIDRAVELTLSKSLITTYAIIGPVGLATSVNLCLNRSSDCPFKAGKHYINNIHFRILQKTHSSEELKNRKVLDGDKTVLLTKYEEYFQDLKLAGIKSLEKNKSQKKNQKNSKFIQKLFEKLEDV